MNKWQKFWGHLRTVQKHRKMVRKLCFKCGLYWQGLTHDLSKYSWVEFWNGVKYFTGKASPHVGERKEKGYSNAWIHHHNRNKHHAEYWWDIKDGKSVPVTMHYKYIAEMICDRIAASMIYLQDKYTDRAPLEYYLSHKDENQFDDTTREELEYCLTGLSEIGLDAFMKDLKTVVKTIDY